MSHKTQTIPWYLLLFSIAGALGIAALLVATGWQLGEAGQQGARADAPVKFVTKSATRGVGQQTRPTVKEEVVFGEDPARSLPAETARVEAPQAASVYGDMPRDELFKLAEQSYEISNYEAVVKMCKHLRIEHNNYAPCFWLEGRAQAKLGNTDRACFLLQIASNENTLQHLSDDIRRKRLALRCIKGYDVLDSAPEQDAGAPKMPAKVRFKRATRDAVKGKNASAIATCTELLAQGEQGCHRVLALAYKNTQNEDMACKHLKLIKPRTGVVKKQIKELVCD